MALTPLLQGVAYPPALWLTVPQVLVEDGLYAFSRNPIYLGFALALLGWAVVLGPLVNLALVALFVLIADRWYIASEERMAEEVFGAAYDAYRRRTRRWL